MPRKKQVYHKMIGVNAPLALHARIRRIYLNMPKEQRPKRMSDFCVSLIKLGLATLEGRLDFEEKKPKAYTLDVHRLQTFGKPVGLDDERTA